MNAEYSLLMKGSKGDANTVYDLVDDFDFVVTENMPAITAGDTKDVVKTEWPDEHGDDVFVPRKLAFKSTIIDIPVGYTGAKGTSFEALRALTDFLSSNGSVTIYNEQRKAGYTCCVFSGVSDAEVSLNGEFEILTAKIKFNVYDPMSKVTARKSETSDKFFLDVETINLND